MNAQTPGTRAKTGKFTPLLRFCQRIGCGSRWSKREAIHEGFNLSVGRRTATHKLGTVPENCFPFCPHNLVVNPRASWLNGNFLEGRRGAFTLVLWHARACSGHFAPLDRD